MEQVHIHEFRQLENEAMLRLRAGAERIGYFRYVLALVLPSFEDQCAYQLMLPARLATVSVSERPVNAPVESAPALAVRTIWRRPADIEKFSNPVTRLKYGIGKRLQPMIEELDVNLATEQVTGVLSRATAMTVPPYVPTSAFGCDGTSYELIFGQSFRQSRFEWWEGAPTGWKPLVVLLHEIETLVASAIASKRT